jgi:hypothetical protein
MRIQEIKIPVLTHLFNEYIRMGGEGKVPVSNIIGTLGVDPIEGVDYLRSWGWLKEWAFSPEIGATISFIGINEIERLWIRKMEEKVISTLGLSNGSGEILEILGFDRQKAEIARDLAIWMRDKRLIEYLHFLPTGEIPIELTKEGWEFYEANKGYFFK